MNIDRWLGVAGLLLGIFGIAFGVWSYRHGIKRRVPTFVPRPNRHRIVDPILTKLADFELSFQKNPVGANGVSATHIFFWNDGELPILQSDILESYAVSLPPTFRILSATVLKTNRAALKAQVTVTSVLECDAVVISFAILEPGDGFELQIIYDGPTDVALNFAGSCLGSQSPRILAPNPDYFVKRSERLQQEYAPLIMTAVIAACVSPLWLLVFFLSKIMTDSHLEFLILGVGGSVVVWYAWQAIREHLNRIRATYVPPEIRRG